MNIFRDNTGTLTEILFEKRNKQYGAYVIRSSYNHTVLKSLGITAGTFILIFFGLFQLVNTKENPILAIGPNVPVEILTIYDAQKKKIELPKVEKQKSTVTASVKPALGSTIGTKVVDSTKAGIKPMINNTPTIGPGTLTSNVPIPGTGTLTSNMPATGTLANTGGDVTFAPDVLPSFPDLPDFLRKNLVYPVSAFDNSIQGRVAVNFVVNEEGKVTEAKVIRGIGYGCDEEALRVIRLTKWKPGMVNGKPVKVNFNQVITFRLR